MIAYGDLPANQIDHDQVGEKGPEAEPTAAYGEYLVDITACKGCHAPNLAGNYGQLPPGVPLGPNLTPGGEFKDWTLDDFTAAIQSGITPDGRILSAEEKIYTPWPKFAHLTPEEVRAIWEYLSSLGPLPNNG